MFKHEPDEYDPADRVNMIYVAAVACALMWNRMFKWMRLHSELAVFIRLLRETIKDLTYFMWLFVFLLATFANIMLILN